MTEFIIIGLLLWLIFRERGSSEYHTQAQADAVSVAARAGRHVHVHRYVTREQIIAGRPKNFFNHWGEWSTLFAILVWIVIIYGFLVLLCIAMLLPAVLSRPWVPPGTGIGG